MNRNMLLIVAGSIGFCVGAQGAEPAALKEPQTVGRIERFDPRLDALIDPDAKIYKLAEGFGWAEGPVWLPAEQVLLFSDVPGNVIHRWRESGGLGEFLRPSGSTGLPGTSKPEGANGLTLDRQGRLLICQHGDRRVVRLTVDKQFEVLADRFDGKRFNSPNDVVVKSDGSIYFTDPPFGLRDLDKCPLKESPCHGVYRIDAAGKVTLLIGDLQMPNGLAFSPDEKRLYIAISDWTTTPFRIMVYDVQDDGSLASGRVFFDAKAAVLKGSLKGKGLPDGLRVDRQGNVFSTGPGGVLVLAPDGTLLGLIRPGPLVANCEFGGEGRSILYMTADHWLCRVQTKTRAVVSWRATEPKKKGPQP